MDTNEERANLAESIMRPFMEITGAEKDDAVCDIIADIMHWCDREGVDFENQLEWSRMHYAAELEEGS